jgi:hypothetical protein
VNLDMTYDEIEEIANLFNQENQDEIAAMNINNNNSNEANKIIDHNNNNKTADVVEMKPDDVDAKKIEAPISNVATTVTFSSIITTSSTTITTTNSKIFNVANNSNELQKQNQQNTGIYNYIENNDKKLDTQANLLDKYINDSINNANNTTTMMNTRKSKNIDIRESSSKKYYEAASTNGATTARTKSIEQLHIDTGEVLRVYPSGKDAAAFMNVSQSGISLCCTGSKPDCYGFKWRIYEGPPIDCKN